MRLSANTWTGYAPLFRAYDSGRLDTKRYHLVESPYSVGILQAVRGGTIDASAVSLTRALIWKSLGVDIEIVYIMDESMGGDALVSRGPLDEMVGQGPLTVAGELDSVSGYLIERALDLGYISQDSIVENHEVFRLPERLRKGDADAVSVYGSYLDTLLHDGYRVFFDSADIPGEIIDVLVVRRDYLEENIGAVANLILAFDEHSKAMESAARDQGIDYVSLQQNETRLIVQQAEILALIKRHKDFARQRGLLGTMDSDLDINQAPLREALSRVRQRGVAR